ncbi:hypothetical protein A3860_37750 [Niastella vici]|uniref:DUF1345 domain-containing protein n=1 Tax=Niastella vici TaxID=1703345 RepID=A0A1V9FM24_9BACT|nr:DUF1345 domain-containing protein [Niastella vici]OQP59405.1 hypothetical protein A3860_37750 [Niastella vici]
MKKIKPITRFHKLPALIRFFTALASAIIILFILRGRTIPVQFMSSWIGFSLVNLIFFWVIMFTAHPREIVRIARKQDSSKILIFFVILLASFVSLVAIVLLLRELPNPGQWGYYYHIVLSIASVTCSWFLIHTIFAFRYAHLYYTCKEEEAIDKECRGGLEFPNDKTPDYLDFAYFSFGLGMTFQVSDVQVTSGIIRRLTLLHSLIAFIFNTTFVALIINIIAGLIQK